MKSIEITKLARIDAPAGEYADIAAFQMIEYVIDYFGNKITGCLDTKIMKNGRQLVVGGDGFFADGYEIA